MRAIYHHTLLYIAGCMLLAGSTRCTTDLTGSEVENERVLVYNTNGTPAAGATVKIVPLNFQPYAANLPKRQAPAIFTTTTDANGSYSVAGLETGNYNILIELDSMVSFQDSAYIAGSTDAIKPDTLNAPGSLTAIVGVQPNHDPRTVVVQSLGTLTYSNVDSDGRFTLRNLARGDYFLQLETTEPGYTRTFFPVTARFGQNDTLADTLWLIYTGIPVVTGLNSSFDTLAYAVHISWNPVDYMFFKDYVINGIQYTPDSFYTENLSYYFFSDTNNSTYQPWSYNNDQTMLNTLSGACDTNTFSAPQNTEYRVAVQSTSFDTGAAQGVRISVPDRRTVITQLTAHAYNISADTSADSVYIDILCPTCAYIPVTYRQYANASPNDSIRFTVHLFNPGRTLVSAEWKDIQTNSVLKTVTPVVPHHAISDTLIQSWNTAGLRQIEISTVDNGGVRWKDTLVANVRVIEPSVDSFNTNKIDLNTPTLLKAYTRYAPGHEISYAWDIGNTGTFVEASKPETLLTLSDTLTPDFQCVLRMTDKGGMVVKDTMRLATMIAWEKMASVDFLEGIMYGKLNGIVFNNILYVIASKENDLYPPAKTWVWSSADGRSWELIADSVGFGCLRNVTAFKGKLYAISHDAWEDTMQLWSSADGINWASQSLFTLPSRALPLLAVIGDTLWIAGDVMLSSGVEEQCAYFSTDGNSFVNTKDVQGTFPDWQIYPRSYCAIGNQIWVHYWYGNGLYNYQNGTATKIQNAQDALLGFIGNPESPAFLNAAWFAYDSSDSTAIYYATNDNFILHPGAAFPDGGYSWEHDAVTFNNKLWLFNPRGVWASK